MPLPKTKAPFVIGANGISKMRWWSKLFAGLGLQSVYKYLTLERLARLGWINLSSTLSFALALYQPNFTMAPKVAIVYYSMYGHIAKLAEAEQAGLKKAGIDADLYQ